MPTVLCMVSCVVWQLIQQKLTEPEKIPAEFSHVIRKKQLIIHVVSFQCFFICLIIHSDLCFFANFCFQSQSKFRSFQFRKLAQIPQYLNSDQSKQFRNSLNSDCVRFRVSNSVSNSVFDSANELKSQTQFNSEFE